jgi:hypothetical protein
LLLIFVRTDLGLWKAITILFLVGASTVFAIDNAERFGIESIMPLQVSSCTELGTTRERQSEYIDMSLATAAKDFLNPPAGFVQLPDRLPVGFVTLPAVPAAIFMVLCGFLCVVFVKDRRVWLVALAGLFWAGQAGINAIPKLVLCLAERNNSSPTQLSQTLYLGHSSVLPGYSEGTRYIGLLRHLAGIPVSSFKFQTSNFKYNKAEKLPVAWPRDAIIPSQTSGSLLRCLIKRTEQFIYFTPAFISDNLARGPPAKS